MKIALISDTHSLLAPDVVKHLKDCDEIWHAGDIGRESMIDELESIAPLRAVIGNIDPKEWKVRAPENQVFTVDGIKVFMTHIGGYPGRYTKRVYAMLHKIQPNLYICGHSHILKVMRDNKFHVLHMNPGACGVVGTHKFRTFLKFEILEGKIENLVAVDLGARGLYKGAREEE